MDFRQLAENFDLDEGTVRDVADHRELARAEWRNNAEYVFVRLPIETAERPTAPLLAIITPQHFLTLTTGVDFRPPQTAPWLPADRPVDHPSCLLPAVLARGVLVYEQRIHALAEKISDARQRMAQQEVRNQDFVEFVAIEDGLNDYRSSLEGMLSVLEQLQLNRRQLFTTDDLDALSDIAWHVKQLLVAINASTHTINSIQNAYSTIANNVLNQRMKVLTVLTILLAIPNVFYGMYGMNIALPMQQHPWAFPVVVGVTLLLVGLAYLVVRRVRLV